MEVVGVSIGCWNEQNIPKFLFVLPNGDELQFALERSTGIDLARPLSAQKAAVERLRQSVRTAEVRRV